jgi:hypothetical protein
MTTQYNSNFDETTPFSDTTPYMALATNVPLSYTVPGTNQNKYQATFSYTCTANIFVGYNVSPTTPTPGTIVTGSNIEFRPKKHYVKGGDVLYFNTPDASAYVGVSLLAIPG